MLFILVTLLSFGQDSTSIFSPRPGLYVGLKEVAFTIPKGSKAYYSTDGNTPNSGYKKLPQKLELSGNTILRVAIYDSLGKKTVQTGSYFIERTYSMPVISISTDPDNFFDYSRGIYVKGCCADTIDPYMGANYWRDWERPINIEFYEKDNTLGFNQEAGVKIFGGFSKSMPQKSLAIYARSKYGEKKFDYPIFPNLDIPKYKNFILRNAGGDMRYGHIRDVFATQLVKNTGLDIQEWRPAVVYINGEYWGIYHIREKINEHYVKAHYGYDKDSLDILRHRNERQHGTSNNYRRFLSYINSHKFSDPKALKYISSQMDIDDYILYNISEVYTGNEDAGGNIRYFKGYNEGEKWRWVFYDLDLGLGIHGSEEYKENTLDKFTRASGEIWPNPSWSTQIIRKILENDSLKYLYINQYADLLNTNFRKDIAVHLLDSLIDIKSQEIGAHLDRWKIRQSTYNQNVDKIRQFALNRPKYMQEHLMKKFDLKDSIHINVVVNKTEGKIKFNTLKLKENYSGTYYSNVPMHIKASPNFDYDLIGWKHSKSTDRKLYESFDKDVMIEPIFQRRANSSYYGNLVVSEINISHGKKDLSEDWIELYNTKSEKLNLDGWFMKDEKDDHTFRFPQGIVLDSTDYLIVTKSKIAFYNAYQDTNNVIENSEFGFGKNDRVRIYDADSSLVVEVIWNGEEEKGTNLALIDFRAMGRTATDYQNEKATPFKPSKSFLEILEQEAHDRLMKRVFFYSGIGLVSIVLIIGFLKIRKGRREKKKLAE